MPQEIPVNVINKLRELDRLVEKYPDVIPMDDAAKFLGVGVEFLKSAVELNNYDWALHCWKDKRGYRAFKILTTPFYFAYSHIHAESVNLRM